MLGALAQTATGGDSSRGKYTRRGGGKDAAETVWSWALFRAGDVCYLCIFDCSCLLRLAKPFKFALQSKRVFVAV